MQRISWWWSKRWRWRLPIRPLNILLFISFMTYCRLTSFIFLSLEAIRSPNIPHSSFSVRALFSSFLFFRRYSYAFSTLGSLSSLQYLLFVLFLGGFLGELNSFLLVFKLLSLVSLRSVDEFSVVILGTTSLSTDASVSSFWSSFSSFN